MFRIKTSPFRPCRMTKCHLEAVHRYRAFLATFPSRDIPARNGQWLTIRSRPTTCQEGNAAGECSGRANHKILAQGACMSIHGGATQQSSVLQVPTVTIAPEPLPPAVLYEGSFSATLNQTLTLGNVANTTVNFTVPALLMDIMQIMQVLPFLHTLLSCSQA